MRLAAVPLALALASACASRDTGEPIGSDRLTTPEREATPRRRPAELAHVTLKVVGMT